MSIIRIGTCGWNYPAGQGTWNGVFYPLRRSRAKSFDELSYYAEHFDTVEVNSTFYGQPRPDVTRGCSRSASHGRFRHWDVLVWIRVSTMVRARRRAGVGPREK